MCLFSCTPLFSDFSCSILYIMFFVFFLLHCIKLCGMLLFVFHVIVLYFLVLWMIGFYSLFLLETNCQTCMPCFLLFLQNMFVYCLKIFDLLYFSVHFISLLSFWCFALVFALVFVVVHPFFVLFCIRFQPFSYVAVVDAISIYD